MIAASGGEAARDKAPAATSAEIAPPRSTSCAIAATLTIRSIATEAAPKLPTRGSRMISSARSRDEAPTASAVSASASTCSAPVSTSDTATAMLAARSGDRRGCRIAAVAPVAAPMPAPTSGKSTAPRATSAPSSASGRPSGSRVRKVTAAAAARTLAAGIGHSSGCEGRHVLHDRGGGVEQGQGEGGAAPLPQPQTEIEQRLETELFENEPVAGLRREVRRNHRVAGVRREPRGDERRRGGDEPVEEDDSAIRRRSERNADEERDLEAAERGQRLDLVVESRRVHIERALDDCDLAREPVVVEPRPAAAHTLGLGRQQRSAECARGRRVADPHLAERDDRDTRTGQLFGERDPGVDLRECFLARHCRPLREVRRPASDARVDYPELCPGGTCQHANGGAARLEVGEHLARHLLRIGADALARDARSEERRVGKECR